MESVIAKAIQLKYQPVALLWSNEKPQDAMQFAENKWGCVMWLVAHAAKGKTAVADIKTFGCFGGGVGLGFGNQYKNFPGGEEGFCHFLSDGNAKREGGKELAEKIKPFMRAEAYDNFLHGERYVKSPALVDKFIKALPLTEIPEQYVVFQPLDIVDTKKEKPQTIIFFVNPDQLSALVVLANYGRGDNENVIIPYAAGCQTIGIYPYREAKSEKAACRCGADRSFRPRLYPQTIRRSQSHDLFRTLCPFRRDGAKRSRLFFRAAYLAELDLRKKLVRSLR